METHVGSTNYRGVRRCRYWTAFGLCHLHGPLEADARGLQMSFAGTVFGVGVSVVEPGEVFVKGGDADQGLRSRLGQGWRCRDVP